MALTLNDQEEASQVHRWCQNTTFGNSTDWMWRVESGVGTRTRVRESCVAAVLAGAGVSEGQQRGRGARRGDEEDRPSS